MTQLGDAQSKRKRRIRFIKQDRVKSVKREANALQGNMGKRKSSGKGKILESTEEASEPCDQNKDNAMEVVEKKNSNLDVQSAPEVENPNEETTSFVETPKLTSESKDIMTEGTPVVDTPIVKETNPLRAPRAGFKSSPPKGPKGWKPSERSSGKKSTYRRQPGILNVYPASPRAVCHQQSDTWKSAEKHNEEQHRRQVRQVKHLFPKNVAMPSSVTEYNLNRIERYRHTAQEQVRLAKLNKATRGISSSSQVYTIGTYLSPVRSAWLDDGRSTVTCQPSIWTRKPMNKHGILGEAKKHTVDPADKLIRSIAEWPCSAKFRHEGDQRMNSTAKHGNAFERFLPLPLTNMGVLHGNIFNWVPIAGYNGHLSDLDQVNEPKYPELLKANAEMDGDSDFQAQATAYLSFADLPLDCCDF